MNEDVNPIFADPRRALIELDRADCQNSLSTFIQRAWHVIEPGAKYVHNWHIDAIAEHLQAVTTGEITRLLINVPPGTSKSLTTSVFWPAWMWGPAELPHYRTLATAHSERLAIRDNMKCRRLVGSSWYQARWPITLMGDQNEKRKFENDKSGVREAMPFTSMTGSRGDFVILDDPLSVDDAKSETKRDAVNETFRESLPSRLNDPERSAIVVIMQRLHERDVSGIILANDYGYEKLILPMEFEPERKCYTSIGFEDPRVEDGELLFPARFPREVVERDKKIMGSTAAAGQLQQRPAPREGGLFKKEWFEIVPAAPAGTRWVRGWDLAASEARSGHNPAYTAGLLLGQSPDGAFYIGDVTRIQGSPSRVETLLRNTASQDGVDTPVSIPQDPGQTGKFQKIYLAKALAGYKVHFSPETGDKVARAEPVSAQAEAGNLKLVKGAWNDAFIDEAILFPNGTHKDQIDALSRAFAYLTGKRQNRQGLAMPMVIQAQ